MRCRVGPGLRLGALRLGAPAALARVALARRRVCLTFATGLALAANAVDLAAQVARPVAARAAPAAPPLPGASPWARPLHSAATQRAARGFFVGALLGAAAGAATAYAICDRCDDAAPMLYMAAIGAAAGAVAGLVVASRASVGPAASSPPPVYPYAGFGRAGCWAGPGLRRMFATGSTRPTSAELAAGPWLVLDALTAGEAHAAGAPVLVGSLLERRDTLERTLGRWARVPGDSIVFSEGSTFPSVTWHFRRSGDELIGTGVLVHDAVTVVNGVRQTSVSRWPVRLVRIPCTMVPR